MSIVIEKMSFKMVWLMSSMFAPHSASTTATAATMPLRSLPRTEITHFMVAPFIRFLWFPYYPIRLAFVLCASQLRTKRM